MADEKYNSVIILGFISKAKIKKLSNKQKLFSKVLVVSIRL